MKITKEFLDTYFEARSEYSRFGDLGVPFSEWLEKQVVVQFPCPVCGKEMEIMMKYLTPPNSKIGKCYGWCSNGHPLIYTDLCDSKTEFIWRS